MRIETSKICSARESIFSFQSFFFGETILFMSTLVHESDVGANVTRCLYFFFNFDMFGDSLHTMQ